MKKLIMIGIVILNFILQTSLYHFISFFGVIPNISLALVVVFALYSDSITGAIIGIITGLLYDIMMIDVFGIYTLLFFLVGSIAGLINEDVNKENAFSFFWITLIAAVVWHLLMYIILFFLGLEYKEITLIMGNIIFEIIIDAALAAVLSKFMLYIFDKFNIKLLSR